MANAAGIRAARAYVEIGVASRLQQGLAKAARQVDRFAKRVQAIGTSIQSLGVRVGAFAGSVGAGMGFAIKTFAAFDDQMRLVGAVTGSTQEQFAMLTEEAERLGRTTSFTASEVAAAMVELGRAGFDPTEIMASTEQILALSRATATELARSANIGGAVLRGFALDASEMGRVVDVMTVAVNGSAQTLEDFYEGIKYVAPLAVEAGASLEDVSAAMGILANNGMRGSLAGNAIARAYKNLSAEARQQALREIGVEAVDAAGNLRPLSDILAELGEKTAGMGSAQRLNIFEVLFGRGQAAALKLAASGAEFDSMLQKLEQSAGRATEIAAQMDAGIGGSFRMMFSAIEGVFIRFGRTVEDTVMGWAQSIQRLAQTMVLIVEKNPELMNAIVKITAGVLAAAAGMIALGVAIKATSMIGVLFGVVLKGLSIALGVVKALSLAFLALNPVVLGVAGGVALLGAWFMATSDNASNAMRSIRGNFSAMSESLKASWGGIANALKSGDLALAGQIALTGLELVWKTGLFALKSLWHDWTHDLAGAFVVIYETVKRVFYKTLEYIAWAIKVAAESLPGGGWLAEQAGLIEQGLGIMGEQSERDEFDRIAGIERERDQTRRGMEAGLAEIRGRLASLNERAAAQVAELTVEDAVFESPEIVNADAAAIEQIAKQPEVADLGSVANRGTFSAFVASRLGTTTTTYEERSLDAALRTASAVEAIEEQMDEGVGI